VQLARKGQTWVAPLKSAALNGHLHIDAKNGRMWAVPVDDR
jgi:hypothetical protein